MSGRSGPAATISSEENIDWRNCKDLKRHCGLNSGKSGGQGENKAIGIACGNESGCSWRAASIGSEEICKDLKRRSGLNITWYW